MSDIASDSSTFVASLAKGLEVIRCFGDQADSLTVSDIANKTGFSRATARRFLLTLKTLGYVTGDSKHFRLTPKVLTLGHAYLSSLSFWDLARHYLEEVTRQTRESSSVAVLDGGEVVYVCRSSAPHRLMSVALHAGARLPAHATSMGQVLLAAHPDPAVDTFIETYGLPAYTRRTISTAEDLHERLRMVRRHGYSLVDQELEPGLRSLAVPVRNRAGNVVAALNISAHSARISKSHILRNFLPHLRCAAEKLVDIT